jgi:hypothetical protein
MSEELVIKNDKQIYFNQIKGVITELNNESEFCSITVNVGHENQRHVNLSLKKSHYDSIASNLVLGDKIIAKFYIVSRNKNDRWYTSANLLEVEKV